MSERRLLAASLAAVVVAETIGIRRRNGATISAITADVFRVDTPAGRVVFALSWTTFAVWYGRHIWRFARSVKAQS